MGKGTLRLYGSEWVRILTGRKTHRRHNWTVKYFLETRETDRDNFKVHTRTSKKYAFVFLPISAEKMLGQYSSYVCFNASMKRMGLI